MLWLNIKLISNENKALPMRQISWNIMTLFPLNNNFILVILQPFSQNKNALFMTSHIRQILGYVLNWRDTLRRLHTPLTTPCSSLSPNWVFHKWEIGHDYLDLCVFYLTHLLAGISTHHRMLNSIKGNATVIKGLVSQLFLAQTRRALNQNRWRTSGARLNTHTESPKARWQAVFLFFIYFLSAWARGTGILCQSVYWSWARSSRAPASLTLSTYEPTQARRCCSFSLREM